MDQVKFYENDLIRLQTYKLNALKLVTQAEFDISKKRKDEIEARERRIFTM